MSKVLSAGRGRFRPGWRLPPDDLLRDPDFRRLWLSILTSTLGGQVTLLALPLTAALLLHAGPSEMGRLGAMETLPFLLFSLPSGVWLDRRRKLPVYLAGETTMAFVLASIPLAWALGWLSLGWLYACAFALGTFYTVVGSAAQVVLTRVVARERLVEAHARKALASSGAEVAGPGVAGALIRLVGAPVALLLDALLLLASVAILRGVRTDEMPSAAAPNRFIADLFDGLRFVARHRLLVALAAAVGAWQFCAQGAAAVQILYATRVLGLGEQAIGLAYVTMGLGTVLAGAVGHRVSRRIGPGPCLILGLALTGAGWLLAPLAPPGRWGVVAFCAMLAMYSTGGVLMMINFLGLRQAVTPAPLLGRMTSTMRWLILLPAGPGALVGGWIGAHHGLRAVLLCAGSGTLLLAAAAWCVPTLRRVRAIPTPAPEAGVRPVPAPLES